MVISEKVLGLLNRSLFSDEVKKLTEDEYFIYISSLLIMSAKTMRDLRGDDVADFAIKSLAIHSKDINPTLQ